MARTFEENMNDKKLTVKSLRVLQEVEGGAFDKISSQIEETNQTIATLQGAQNRYWDSIADDNIITVEEKRILYKEKQSLDTEYSIVIQNAEKNKDYVDYTSLVEAYQNLNSYLAFIKVFENLGSNTKIDNRTEFYDAFDSYYIALNNVNQAILNKASVGDLNVGNPDKITGLKAVASEKGIYVSFNQLSSEVKNNIGKYIYKLNKGDGVLYLFKSQINGFTYEFDRLVDGFPEAEDIKDWEWTVSAVSVYGKENEESNIATVNVDTYGTWIPTTPKIDKATNKRQVSMTFSQPITSRILYGEIQYGITIRKQGETTFYTPELDKDPKENVNNYKKSSTNSHFVTSYFSQTLPLSGQNNTKWKKKYHEITQGSSVEKNISTSYLTNINSESIPSNATKEYDSSGNLIKVKFSKSSGSITMYYEYTLVDMPSPVDTTYQYKIIVKNITTNKEYSSLVANPISLVATANGVGDLVDNAITQNALAPDAVTADKIAAGTVTADKIAAENILAKGARAGMVSTEGLQVDDSGFFASEPFNYKYHDPVTGAEKSYKTSAGEFFVGNSPDVNDSRDVSEFLHYKKGEGGGFWLKIKNFIVKGLSTIINGVFVVKKTGEADVDSFLVANATATEDSVTGVSNYTLAVSKFIFKQITTYNSDFYYFVIPLLEITSSSSSNRFIDGDIILKRSNGFWPIDIVSFVASKIYSSTASEEYYLNLKKASSFTNMGTFNLNGKKYLGVVFNVTTATCENVYFKGLCSDRKSPILRRYYYYNRQTSEVLNQEIYNSLIIIESYTKDMLSLKEDLGVPSLDSYITQCYIHQDRYIGTFYKQSMRGFLERTHPKGLIYMSVDSTSPATLFGGYWVRLKDRFLVGASDISGSAFAPGAMAGKSVITDVPAHTHEISMDSAGDHQHTTAGNNSFVKKGESYMLIGSGTAVYEHVSDGETLGAGSHKHNLYIKETGSVGVNILPPYLAVYMWKRISAEEAATLSIT